MATLGTWTLNLFSSSQIPTNPSLGSLVLVPTSSGLLDMSAILDDETEKRPQKKFKITASNGYLLTLERQHSRQLDSDSPSSSQPKRAIVKGRLAALLSLPLDVLFEIFGHLLPQDILHLTRIAKDFRRLLLDKSARPIWKDAFANVPALPACPPEMSLPAWADLVFGSHCYNCFSAKTRNVDFILRVRLCGTCAKTCLISAKQFDTERKMDKIILRCVPFTSTSPSRNGSCCTVKAKDAFVRQLNDRQHEDVNAFVQEKKAEMKARKEHGKKCKAWVDGIAKQKVADLDEIRKERKKAIIKKLTGLGFISEIEYMDQLERFDYFRKVPVEFLLLRDHPDVKVPKPLTERMWNNMQDSMIDYMHRLQQYRIKDDRRNLKQTRKDLALRQWHKFRKQHIESLFMPSPVDILEWYEVESIVKSPNDAKITIEMFATLFNEKLANFIRDWTKDQLGRLSILCTDYIPQPWHLCYLQRVQMAVSVFTCLGDVHELEPDCAPDAYSPMWYPEFLHHSCNSICWKHLGAGKKNERLDKNESLDVNQRFKCCRRKAWSPDLLSFDEKASRVVRGILKACGRDPGTTTVAMLDELDPRLVCLKCSFGATPDGERRFSVWSWRNAVQHCMKSHFGDSRVTWQKIADAEASEARILESKEPTRRGVGVTPERIWRCTKCIDLPADPGIMTMEILRSHYDVIHVKPSEDIEKGKDYYRAQECPPKQPLIVKMIPKAAPDAPRK